MKLKPENWQEWKPVIHLLAWALALIIGGVQNQELFDREDILEQDNQNYGDLVRYHAQRDAACDTALEMYHGPDDWPKVLEECHSGEE